MAGEVYVVYGGFNKDRRKNMFDEEMKELGKVYKDTHEKVSSDLEEFLPEFLESMQEFIDMNKQVSVLEEKMRMLEAKLKTLRGE